MATLQDGDHVRKKEEQFRRWTDRSDARIVQPKVDFLDNVLPRSWPSTAHSIPQTVPSPAVHLVESLEGIQAGRVQVPYYVVVIGKSFQGLPIESQDKPPPQKCQPL